MWGAGDSKLWLFVNFLYPAGWYLVSDQMLFPLMFLLMIIFIEAYFYLLCESVWLAVFHKDRAVLFQKEKFQIDQIWDIIFSISCLSIVYTICSYILNGYYENNRIFFSLLGILFAGKLISVRISYKRVWTILAFAVYIIMNTYPKQSYDFRLLIMTAVLVIVTHISLKFTDCFNYEWIRTQDIKTGMILSYWAIQQFYGSRVKGLPSFTDETTKSRISQEEAEAIKRWEKSKYGKEYVMIVRYIPFAIFILSGLFTYLMGVWRIK